MELEMLPLQQVPRSAHATGLWTTLGGAKIKRKSSSLAIGLASSAGMPARGTLPLWATGPSAPK